MYVMCLSKGLGAIQQSINEGILLRKKLGFISTAGETYANPYFVDESRRRLRALGISLIELDITNAQRETLIKILEDVDGIFVAGGNSFFLLQQLKNKGLDTYIADKVRDGLPYFGESAGAVLLTQSIEPAKPIDDPQDAPELSDYRGLGLIDFFPLPHVDREKYREVFEAFIAENEGKLTIVQYQDNQAIITRDGSNYDVVPSEIVSV